VNWWHAVVDVDGIRLDDVGDDDGGYQQLSSVVYEQQLRRHGWRMEVPGDPLNLKCVCRNAPTSLLRFVADLLSICCIANC